MKEKRVECSIGHYQPMDRKGEMKCEDWFTFSMSRSRDCARGSDVASIIPSNASVWWRRASIASMYPLGGPRFRDGPRKVQAAAVNEHFLWYWLTGMKKEKKGKMAVKSSSRCDHVMYSHLRVRGLFWGNVKTYEHQALHNFYMVHLVQSVHICTWTCGTGHRLNDERN